MVVYYVHTRERTERLDAAIQEQSLEPGALGECGPPGCAVVQAVGSDKILYFGKLDFNLVCWRARAKLEKSRVGVVNPVLLNYPTRDRVAVAQTIALQFNMVPKEHMKDVQAAFPDGIADVVMRSGEIGPRYLFNTLDDLRRLDIVLQMARQEEHPSYMRFLRRGETTLLEFWQDEYRSKCHDMLGTIYEWFYAAVLRIRPIGDAYKTFSVRPPFARASSMRLRGQYSVRMGS